MITQAPPFDTHRFIKHLTDSGVGETQAEAHAKAVNEALTGGVATGADIETLRADMRADMTSLETRLTIRGIVALFVTASAIVGLMGFGFVYTTNLILSAIAG